MKPSRWILTLLILAVLLSGMTTSVYAKPPMPRTPSSPPSTPPQPPARPEIVDSVSPSGSTLPPLKAVLLVGPIDGDYGTWTTQEKQNMDLAAAELQANGVTVHKFYTPNNNWDAIRAAADGAHFLFYRGHGVYWSPMPTPTVGGFSLKSGFVSSNAIRNDLNLAPNAIVMLYSCFSAGSSSIDGGPITSTEAQRRVAQYSDPFLDIGAGGYYANWYGNAFQMFVRYLFQGKTLGEAYEAYADFNPASVERYVHPNHPSKAMWLDKNNWGYTQYNNAFVGLPDRTLANLFKPEMELIPSAIIHMAEPSFPERSFTLQVGSSGPGTFTWAASVEPAGLSWIDIQPSSGSNGEEITVSITPNGQALDTYQANIRIVADDPEIINGDQTIPITLRVLDRVYYSYLPIIIR